MNHPFRAWRLASLPGRIRGMFNLNDPRWGRGDDKADGANRPDSDRPNPPPGGNRGRDPQGQPPDLDELWRDLNRKLGGLFGGRNGGGRGPGNGSGGGFQPDMKNTGVGVGLIAAVAVLIWLGSGFFIVQEGQQAVITQFGKYKTTVNAGFNWRLPYPIQRHELVFVTQIRSADVGRDSIIKSTGLRESAMLTEDENIVEIKFAVQYRLNDARAWLFESRNPGEAVIQVAETAVREIVGKMRMDTALAEERDQIAPRVRTLMQTILDRYKIGVEVVGINLQQGGVRPPEQVQAAFDDVLKAGQGARAREERSPGLRQRRDSPRGRFRFQAHRGSRRLQGPDRRPGAGGCPALQLRAHRVSEGAAGHPRPHVPRSHAADLLERHQGAGGLAPGFEPAVSPAGQDHAERFPGRSRRGAHPGSAPGIVVLIHTFQYHPGIPHRFPRARHQPHPGP